MKVTLNIEVTDCRDCLFKYNYSGQEECWSKYNYPNTGMDSYDMILWGCQEEFKEVLAWCPIGLGKTNEK